jgi:two-component system, OmpR family, KDP operon response regulator KdpE
VTQSTPRAPSSMMPVRPPFVLVAEDDAAIRDLLTEALEAAGFRVSAVRDGFAALNEVRRAAPDVIVLDLGLPLLDGQEFLDAWRTVESLPHVPVLVLSASSELPPLLASVGVQGHITKPFDVDAVVEAVGRLARGRRGR